MSRQKHKARDKTTHKMSRDGLVERNAATGAETSLSNREKQADLRGGKQVTPPLSQVGTRAEVKQSGGRRKKHGYQRKDADLVNEAFVNRAADVSVELETPHIAESPIVAETPRSKATLKHEPRHGISEQSDTRPHNPYKQGKFVQPETAATRDAGTVVTDKAVPSAPAIADAPRHESALRYEPRHSLSEQPRGKSKRLRKKRGKLIQDEPTALTHESEASETLPSRPNETSNRRGSKPPPNRKKPQGKRVKDTPPTEDGSVQPTHTEHILTEPAHAPTEMPDSPLKGDKPGKLKFSADEAAPEAAKPTRKVNKAQRKSDKANTKLEKAKGKLPTKKKLRIERTFDEKKGKPKTRLHFEKEVKSQAQHVKGALPLRPIKAGGNALIGYAHKKMFQVEHENVGTQAAHKTEMAAEGGVRFSLRHHKTAPYRKVAKLEKRAMKKSVKLSYQKALAENPKWKGNPLARAWQKRKIKKDYAKKAREAKKAAERAKKAGSATAQVGRAIVGVIKRHPIAAAVVVLIALLIFMMSSLFSSFGGAGTGGLGAILNASYLADDADIDKAELSYTEWEADLRFQISGVEASHPGYDEYRYNVGDVSHNPYELMAYLTARYQNFPYDGVSADLRALLGEQYVLTFTPSTETKYRDDGEGGQEAYDWHVLTTTLTARSFSDIVASHLTVEQLQHFGLLLQTKGSRQYVGNPFDFSWLPYVTSYYGYRVHPTSGAKDYHKGVDVGVPTGTDIHAGLDGTVTAAAYDAGGYGYYVAIKNDKGVEAKYAHCDSLLVSVGQTVKKGDVIAKSGNTGNSTGAHLHLEVLKDDKYLNPLYFADTGDFGESLPIYGDAGAAMGDGSYAALIAEGEKFLGYPYVFGGSSPSTSFDCSGFICWIFTHSGVYNLPRTTAQGIYNQCTPIPASEARPGDLVFFERTYSTTDRITHIGLYVGNGRMLHCGSPISYADFASSSYWQSHSPQFGRLQ